jgi:hypothetical protein
MRFSIEPLKETTGMKPNVWMVALLAAYFLLSSRSYAAVEDGTNLLKLCQSVDKVETTSDPGQLVDVLQCQAYIEGVFTGYSMLSHALNLKDVGIESVCVPNEAKLRQIYLVVQKYLKDHPGKLHTGAGELTMTALKESFPCK